MVTDKSITYTASLAKPDYKAFEALKTALIAHQ